MNLKAVGLIALLMMAACQPDPLEEAQKFMRAGNVAAATDIYRAKALGKDPDRLKQLAECLVVGGQLQEAAQAYEAMPEALQGPEGKRVIARARGYDGQKKEAEDALKALYVANPQNADILATLGEIQGMRGNGEGAKASFQQALIQDPNHSRAYTGLGDVAFSIGDIDTAKRQYQKAIALGGLTAGVVAQTRLARLLMAMGNETEAKEILYAARATLPQHPAVNGEVGQFMVREGYLKAALSVLKEAQLALGEEPDVMSHIAYIFTERAKRQRMMGKRVKDLQAAQMWYERVLKVDARRYDVLNDLGVVRTLLKDQEGATAAFQAAIELSPGRLDAYLSLGRLYVNAGLIDRARSVFDAGLKLDPQNVILQINLGVLALRQENFSTAEAYFDTAEISCLGLPPAHPCRPELYYNRARIAGHNKDIDAAVDLFLKAWGAGYRDVGRIFAEPDLAEVRGDIRVANQLDAFQLRISN